MWLVALVILQELSQKPGRKKPGTTRQQQRMRSSHPMLRFEFHPVPYANAQVSWPAQATQSVVPSGMQVLGEDPSIRKGADAGFRHGMQVKDAGACIPKERPARDAQKCGFARKRVVQQGGQW